ncbi:putative chromatin regulator PHD family [Helianthus annuus]|uniref:Chromatin regulator PHD family n=1 Tax=Helianthus annuus TaxID=4232 RepID=A0A251V1B9_HELAN|nr:putative chromatin regulator PHD family [Helianthus annuus]KAJ0598277.1 putative chromatin regulator PHD family [Helianthus annuus]KAJ0762554.1 putative chromatin regulator PHD family [Helianthus annuus]KAJ0928426.1 putative chromatin regulator PHD family [Helianthus annuus]
MFGKSMNLITTVIGFAMSATFIVFVCARLFCGRFRRYESRELFEIDSRIDLERQEHRVVGLEPAMVAAIPTMKFDREAFGSMEDAQCTICLGEYQEKEVLRIMPKCGHSFHLSCIDLWLRKQSTCPVCRLSVKATNSPEISREISMERSRQWLLSHPGQGSSQSQSQSQRGDSAMGDVEAGSEAGR